MLRKLDSTMQMLEKKISVKDADDSDAKALEYLKCRQNPLYYILNYVYLPEIGGLMKYESERMHKKLRRVVRVIYKHHKCMLMASRQLGKSSIAAALLSWALLFFPKNRAVILNMQKSAAQENVKKIKFIIEHLPEWMRGKDPFLSKAEIKSYVEFRNGSRIDTFYPSASHSPDTLARSLTVPILYVDETAFIRHISDIYGSAQPTLLKAREDAIKNNYPYFIMMTSTPNGVEGTGKFFHEYWENAVDSDILFDQEDKEIIEMWRPDAELSISNPAKNSFIKVMYHWEEDPTKDQAWYQNQCREVNFDQRKINQELDLIFVGSSDCIFTDEVLSELQPVKNPIQIPLVNQCTLNLYTDELNDKDYYLVGVDTASSLDGSYNAIEIFSYKDFIQVGEVHTRLGSLTKYGQVVDDVFKKLRHYVGDRIKLCIENNSIGKAIIEHLLYHVPDLDYTSYLFKEQDIKGQPKKDYGVNTNTSTRELMISISHGYVSEIPARIKSATLCSHLNKVERTASGRINCSDTYMAMSFCAYVRRKTILEVTPLIDVSDEQASKSFFNDVKNVLNMSNIKKLPKQHESNVDVFKQVLSSEQDAHFSEQFLPDEDFSSFFPFVSI